MYLRLREHRLDSKPYDSTKVVYSEETTKKLLSLIYNTEEAGEALEKTKPRKRKREVKQQMKIVKKVERIGLKDRAKNCQNIALVFKGASQAEAAITEKFIKERNKRRREEKLRMQNRSWLVDIVRQSKYKNP